ncbi:uncharacterized protein PADG_11521 [Paracoccidioides brasiliensis Pb18]|uniref:Uncharacterized protein n=1 Tax=Paracoccidioides brasiliensis (strain Pb18) TaxID=502780 RepID=A0A0A0HWA4_PARBD|nr:uncharacterized protein PADG_11521 [Paracoccidioides brasiliensis Pb18]KGM92326.1 hypothetical protein PADG_11521 [Paracoccidioides brasiliensis Pb18]
MSGAGASKAHVSSQLGCDCCDTIPDSQDCVAIQGRPQIDLLVSSPISSSCSSFCFQAFAPHGISGLTKLKMSTQATALEEAVFTCGDSDRETKCGGTSRRSQELL